MCHNIWIQKMDCVNRCSKTFLKMASVPSGSTKNTEVCFINDDVAGP